MKVSESRKERTLTSETIKKNKSKLASERAR